MSRNISRRQLVEPSYVEEVNAILRVAAVSGGLIQIEITKSVYIDVMNPLYVSGLGLFMDEFDTSTHHSVAFIYFH